MSRSCRLLTPIERAEMAAQSDMAERARRLTAHRDATRGKVFSEVEPGVWRYVVMTPDDLPEGIATYLYEDREAA